MIAGMIAILAGLILLTGLLGVIPAFGGTSEEVCKMVGKLSGSDRMIFDSLC